MSRLSNGGLDAFKAALARHRGKSVTYLHLSLDDGGEAVMVLGDNYRVTATDALIAELERMLSPGAVELK